MAPGGQAAIEYSKDRIELENVRLVNGAQMLDVSGQLMVNGNRTAPSAITVRASNVDLAQLDLLLLQGRGFSGTLNANAQITGDMTLIGYAIWSFLIVIIGTKLMPEPTTKADFQEAFRVIGFTASPGIFNVLAIIPFLGPLISFVIGLWMLVIGVIAVRQVLDYSNTGRAIIVCLIALIVWWCVVFLVLTPLFIARVAMS